MRKALIALMLVSLLVIGMFPAMSIAEESSSALLVGAAIRDVTPTIENGMLPIPGIGRDIGPITGVHDPINTRVIALKTGETTALIVVTETGKGPYGPQFAPILSEHTGVPIEAIFYMATHTHSAPEITQPIDLDFKEGDEVTSAQLWGKYALAQILDAADEAIAKLQPAKVAIGYGESYINVNRNYTYTLRDGTSSVYLGYNPTGVSDKTLTVMRFDSMDDKPIAFLVNYPVHMITMFANTYFEDGQALSSDVNGYVSALLEKQNEGAIAVWTSGAAGDQNPIGHNSIQTPDPETGAFSSRFTGSYDLVEYWGNYHFADITKVLGTMGEGTPNLSLTYAEGISTIPTREGAENDEFRLDLKVLRIGDIALVGSPGELFSSLGVYMKEKSLLKDTIIFNHVWTQEGAFNGYICDDEGIEKAFYGYSPNRTVYALGTINDGLANLMNELIAKTE